MNGTDSAACAMYEYGYFGTVNTHTPLGGTAASVRPRLTYEYNWYYLPRYLSWSLQACAEPQAHVSPPGRSPACIQPVGARI